jgi:hypothetical protein
MKVRLIRESSIAKTGPKSGEIGELYSTERDKEGDKRVFVKFPSQNGLLSVLYASQVVPYSGKVKVVLFKPSGKYYTEEEWEIPENDKYSFLPSCMKNSPNFRRISGGAVLIESQEPWGYPHLFPSEG